MTLAKPKRALNAPSPRPNPLPWGFYMTDEVRHPDPLVVVGRLPSGTGVIFRHYAVPDRAARAAELARLCRQRGLTLLVGNDPRLALAVEADGVHFAEGYGRRLAAPLRRPAPRWLVSMAAHSASAMAWANRLGVDLALVSPVFATPSHPEARVLGVGGLARLCRKARCPVFALGGVTLKNWPALRQAGAAGLAGIGLFESLSEADMDLISRLVAHAPPSRP